MQSLPLPLLLLLPGLHLGLLGGLLESSSRRPGIFFPIAVAYSLPAALGEERRRGRAGGHSMPRHYKQGESAGQPALSNSIPRPTSSAQIADCGHRALWNSVSKKVGDSSNPQKSCRHRLRREACCCCGMPRNAPRHLPQKKGHDWRGKSTRFCQYRQARVALAEMCVKAVVGQPGSLSQRNQAKGCNEDRRGSSLLLLTVQEHVASRV